MLNYHPNQTYKINFIHSNSGELKGAISYTKAQQVDFSSPEIQALKNIGQSSSIPVFSCRDNEPHFLLMAENELGRDIIKGSVSRFTRTSLQQFVKNISMGGKDAESR